MCVMASFRSSLYLSMKTRNIHSGNKALAYRVACYLGIVQNVNIGFIYSYSLKTKSNSKAFKRLKKWCLLMSIVNSSSVCVKFLACSYLRNYSKYMDKYYSKMELHWTQRSLREIGVNCYKRICPEIGFSVIFYRRCLRSVKNVGGSNLVTFSIGKYFLSKYHIRLKNVIYIMPYYFFFKQPIFWR